MPSHCPPRGALALAGIALASLLLSPAARAQVTHSPATALANARGSIHSSDVCRAADAARPTHGSAAARVASTVHFKALPQTQAPGRRYWWLGGVATGYALIGGASYMAWYRDRTSHDFEIDRDGWFGHNTYAGGADKLGHFYSNLLLTRGMGGILRYGGFSRRESIVWSAALSTVFHLGVEIKDGYYYGFSFGDLTANLLGATLGAALSYYPELDRALDVRIRYVPSSQYIDELKNGGSWNFQEDYQGQTYLLAFHLEAIPWLRDSQTWRWTRYVDVFAGFRARGYHAGNDRRQELMGGIGINLQQVLRLAFGPADARPRGVGPTARAIAEFAAEVYSPPFTTLPLLDADRHDDT